MTRIGPLSLFEWNAAQLSVWLRCVRRYGWPCTPDVVRRFAAKFAEKHSDCRYRAAA